VISLDAGGVAWQQRSMRRKIILGLVLLGLAAWLLLVTIGEITFW
jgi:hypothetical protein